MSSIISMVESLTVEFKSDRKRLSDVELVEAVVCLANADDGVFGLGSEDDDPSFACCAPLHAGLDAYYARLYGLTRDELRYSLDPADVLDSDYPSETLCVLKSSEFGEYRTQKLVLAAWDAMDNTH